MFNLNKLLIIAGLFMINMNGCKKISNQAGPMYCGTAWNQLDCSKPCNGFKADCPGGDCFKNDNGICK